MKNVLCFVLMAIVSVASTHGQNMNTKDQALEATLEKFAADQKLSGKEMAAMLSKYLFDQPLFSKKANLGLIDGAAHVDLAASNNRILLENGKQVWEGKPRDETEIVVLLRQGEVIRLRSDGDTAKGDILLVKFTPDKVQIIDLEKGDGGFYDRAKLPSASDKK